MLLTQLFSSLKGGPGEAYNAWREGREIRCIGHPAIDINCPTGTPVYAVKDGTVQTMFGDQFFGNFIVLTFDGTGEQFTYAHLSTIQVSNGQHVKASQEIALSGSTGNSTGPHLHAAYRPAKPNYDNFYDGYEQWLTHLDKNVRDLIDLSLV